MPLVSPRGPSWPGPRTLTQLLLTLTVVNSYPHFCILCLIHLAPLSKAPQKTIGNTGSKDNKASSMSNYPTVANALEYLEVVRRTNPSANVAFQHVGGSVRVVIAGIDVTDQVQAPDPSPEDLCPHCGSLPCALDGLDEYLEDEGNSLSSNGSCPRHIRFCLHRIAHMVLDGSSQRKKLPSCVEGFIKSKFPNAEPGDEYIGYYEAEEQAAIHAKKRSSSP